MYSLLEKRRIYGILVRFNKEGDGVDSKSRKVDSNGSGLDSKLWKVDSKVSGSVSNFSKVDSKPLFP